MSISLTESDLSDSCAEGPRPAAAERSDGAALRLLLLEGDRALRDGAAGVLRHDGHQVHLATRGEEAMTLLRRQHFDVVIADLAAPDLSGVDIIAAVRGAQPNALVIATSSNATADESLGASRAGAWEYLPKPFAAVQLQVLIGRAVLALRGDPDAGAQNGLAESEEMSLLGNSPALRQALDLARRVAATSASVMLTGESGTGKELVARLIHLQSRRAAGPFVPVNCAALPENLLESEMFGHRKGAFTGADRNKAGLLEASHRGTLFLDELGEMPLGIQAKLLRVVQDGVIRRLGSEQQDAVVDVRFISATNRDPREAVRQKRLREDLLYRLRVIPIHLPPLRERPEDIPILAEHFLREAWRCHRRAGDAPPRLVPRSFELLTSHQWPGNVRELRNVMEHLAVIADPGQRIEPYAIPLDDQHGESAAAFAMSPRLSEKPFHEARNEMLARFEKEYLRRVIERASGNMSQAARMAGIDRTTLYRVWQRHTAGELPRPLPACADAAVDGSDVYTPSPACGDAPADCETPVGGPLHIER